MFPFHSGRNQITGNQTGDQQTRVKTVQQRLPYRWCLLILLAVFGFSLLAHGTGTDAGSSTAFHGHSCNGSDPCDLLSLRIPQMPLLVQAWVPGTRLRKEQQPRLPREPAGIR